MFQSKYKLILLLSLVVAFLFVIDYFDIFDYKKLNGYDNDLEIIVSEVVPNNRSLRHDGKLNFNDYIVLYNNTTKTINLENYSLSDDFSSPDKWKFPFCEVKPYEELCVFLDGKDIVNKYIHTNFSLNNEGEEILLKDKENNILFKWRYEKIDVDIAYTYEVDKYYLEEKNEYNNNSGTNALSFKQYLIRNEKSNISFSNESGFYEKEFELVLSTENNNCIIRYTLDGSEPTNDSKLYTSPISITTRDDDQNEFVSSSSAYAGTSYIANYIPNPQDTKRATVIKACAFIGREKASEIFTNTYFIDAKGENLYSLPVISIVCDSDDLFSDENGIYVVGNAYENKDNIYEQKTLSTPANYNQRGEDWRRPCSIEYFQDSEIVYEQDLGIQIFGGASRGENKKSFKLITKSFSEERINYDFFDDLENMHGTKIISFDELILRNGGSLNEGLAFLDSLNSELVANNLDSQSFRNVIVFLNGNYYGIYQLIESFSEDYISNHYNVEYEEVEMFKTLDYDFENIKNDYYKELLEYAKNNDLSLDRNYKSISRKIDIDNMLEYFVFQMYIGNTDWPAANNRIWRLDNANVDSQLDISDGKYRYVIYDTDCGMNRVGDFRFNELHPTIFHWVFENKYQIYQESNVHSLYIIEELIKNLDFRQSFINKFCDRVNVDYTPEKFCVLLDSFVSELEPEIENDMKRYNYYTQDIGYWYKLIDTYRNYVNNRFVNIFDEMADYFDCQIGYLSIDKCKGGCVDINNNIQVCLTEDFNGKYMSGYDIVLTAVASEGYAFSVWSDGCKDKVRHIMFDENTLDISIYAEFEKVE